MKLLLIVDNINKVGGIERVISNLSNYFYENFLYEIEIVSIFSSNNPLFFKFDENIKITYLNEAYKYHSNIFEQIKYYDILVKDILINRDVDIIMTFYSHISKAVLKNKKFKKNAKIIVTEHIDYYESSLKGRILKNIIYRKADKLVVLTDEYNCLYSRFMNNVITIPNPISFVAEEKSKLNKKRIISIGRIEKIKGFDVLIDIFKKISDIYIDWELVIVGDGIEKENLKQQININGLNNRVILKDFTPNVKEELMDSSIYAMTSRHEGFGLVLIEAQECGLPCISFDIIPAQDIISDNVNGLLVKRWDIDEYVKKLSMLIESYEKRIFLGNNAKINAKNYRIEVIAEKWNELIKEIIY